MPRREKDPNAVLDYTIDLAAYTNGSSTDPNNEYLDTANSETISSIVSVTVSPTGELTVDSSALAASNTQIVVWLSSGVAGKIYDVTARFTTSASRTDDRTFQVLCKEK